MSEKSLFGWHFTSDTLRDGRPIPPIGEWLVHEGDVIPCQSGLHLSPHPSDALQYAPGNILNFCELRGDLVPHGDPVDKYAGRERRIIASRDITQELWQYARSCALSVMHLWEAPSVVKEYLETGKEELRDAARAAARAARAAAWDAAGAAARDAARAAARAARAASWSAARDAAGAAARAARAAAGAAARAAWDAARAASASRFGNLILNLPEFSKEMTNGRISQS